MIEYAHPNVTVTLASTPNDPLFSYYQNALHDDGLWKNDIDAPEAWSIEYGDSTIIVAIIDTGVDIDHPDLANNVKTNLSYDVYGAYIYSLRNSLLSNASQPVAGDGVLQMDAVSDTVSALYVTSWGDSILTYIPVVESTVTVELWGRTYYQWEGELYTVTSDEFSLVWSRMFNESFRVTFFDTVDLAAIDAFIADNNLEVGYKMSDRGMYLKIDDSAQFLIEQQDNPIIEDAYLSAVVCLI